MLHHGKLLVCLLFLTSIAMGQETFLDTFSSVSYSNNNGSVDWASDWIESGDPNSGPTGDFIYINGNRLTFYYLFGETIRRTANLSGANTATLTFNWQTSGLNGSKALIVQASNNGGASYTTIATMSGNNSSGTVSQSITAFISSNTTIRFRNNGNNWDDNDFAFIDNVQITVDQLSPVIEINDITVDEGAGTATFTATHTGADSSGPFTVNFTTANGTAVSGNDYTLTSGTLNFNGISGDTETISVPITDDVDFEATENFTVSFTASSNALADISDTATGTITDNDVLGNTPLSLFQEFDGYIGYTSTGGTLRTNDNVTDACSVTTTSSNTLTSPIPAGATIDKAYLYWAHSNATPDTQVTFEDNVVNADFMYTTSIDSDRIFYGGVSDVTSIINGLGTPSTNSYDFSDLTIDTSATYCSSATVLGGWSLFIFYTDINLPASTINLYQGFNGESNSSSSFSLDGFFAIGAAGSKTSILSWEGDQTLSNNELLTVTTGLGTFTLAGDGDNNGTTVNNPFNSTIFDNTILPNVNNNTVYGVDLDTYDVSPYIQAGESSVTTTVQSGQDFVVMNAVVLKVPSNLITGRIFEDISYGGGAGRNRTVSSGVGVAGAIVEIYDNGGSLVTSTTTDNNGDYVFGGMANGTYSVRVVNGSVTSSRGGGSLCTSCIPVQTFKTDYIGSTLLPNTDEVGGSNPSGTDPAAGTLTGAQTVGSVTIISEGVAGLDFGFNFNTIVNTNEDGQGSLEQFIVNSNNLDETGLDIEANGIFDPVVGNDTSIFMIPSTSDPLGRTPDGNFSNGYFNIELSNVNPLTPITGNNTVIDGRTQTSYSGNTNTGTVGAGGTAVGTSGNLLPNYDRPEIQVYRPGGDVLRLQGTDVVIRNLAVYANNNAGVRMDSGSASVSNNLLGVNALGSAVGGIDDGVEILGGSIIVDGNYISDNTDAGIMVSGGTSSLIQNNHIVLNGNTACDDNITLQAGSGIIIQQNLIENAASLGIDGDGISGNVTITENTIRRSGENGGNCGTSIGNSGVLLDGSNSSITNNIINNNGGAGIVLAGGPTSGNLISRNSIFANGTAGAALGIDLDQSDGTSDGITLNDTGDSDNGPNGAINFPVISAAYMSGTNIVVSGWSRPGATIEFFLTDVNQGTASIGDNQLGLSVDYGEGQVFLASLVEGGASDTDFGTSFYLDADGNTDNTNRFTFRFTAPPGISLGDDLTATATIANSTSEFSPFSKIKTYSVITNRRITYRVKKQ